MKGKTYTVVYEHDDATWFAKVTELEGCFTQGRTIAQARERIREAIGLFDDHADRAILVDDVKLPAALRGAIRAVMVEREKYEALGRSIQQKHAKLARTLTSKKLGLSRSDAGELLGVSKQRVQQILDAEK